MARHACWVGFFALLLAAAACGDQGTLELTGGTSVSAGASGGSGAAGGGETPDAGADATPPDAGAEPDPSEPFFAGGEVPLFAITLSDSAVEGLGADPKTYVKGDLEVHWKGQVISLPAIGVRLKGNLGSLRDLDGKAAFLLKFDKYTDDQEFLGMEKLVLNNMVQDASMIHESLAYSLFRAGDVPAPRSAYATVEVNGAPYGLYSTVEVTDSDRFLKTWFGADSGSLYEGAYGSDLEYDKLSSFDQDKGEDVGVSQLQVLVGALNAMTNPDTFLDDASKVIDMDRYLAFAATEIFLGHWDGYAWTRNNFFLYRRPDDGRWTFIPWGADQTFSEYLAPFGGEGRLEQMCVASLPCRLGLAKAFEGVIARVEQLGLTEDADALKAAIWDAASADPRKEVDMGTMDGAINATIDFLKNRPADVQAGLLCADPSKMDIDGDGSPGCGQDCDDNDPTRYPGAPETCELVDNDCNGVMADGPMCPPCVVVPQMGGGSLAFCLKPQPYAKAEADCVAQGGHLVSLHEKVEQDAVVSTALTVADDSWWIGLDDIASEGMFAWTDKTPVDYKAWSGGEPNNAGDNEDCGHIANWAGGSWNDIPCSTAMRYICRLP